jgi:hypothetical protein
MLIESADDKFNRLALLQGMQRPLLAIAANLFLRERRYALKVIDLYPCPSKRLIL